MEAAVVGVPDPEGTRGLLIKAFVILRPGVEGTNALRKELQDHVKEATAPYKYPRLLDFVSSLPKTVSGKIRVCFLCYAFLGKLHEPFPDGCCRGRN